MSEAASGTAPPNPSLRRRMACFVYEGVLLFGVVMITALFYAGLTQQRHAISGRAGLMAALFIVIGLYFVWFWSHGGQTLAMKTWRLRLVNTDGGPVTPWRALARYLLSWLWFVPALLATSLFATPSKGAIFGALFVGVVAWAMLSIVHPTRQFLHDVLSGTRLVATDPAP